MSNTTSVTPYDAQASTETSVLAGAATVVGTGIAGTASVIRWLVEETEQERAAITASREADRKRQVSAVLRVISVGLNIRDSGALVTSAKALGYRSTGPARSGVMLFQNARGQRLAVEASPSGKVVLHSASGRSSIETVVRQHTFDQVKRHLAEHGMGVRVNRMGVADVQVSGREPSNRNGDGMAVVNACVKRDGSMLIDVEQIKGRRCEQIVAGLVKAVGGEVTEIRCKHSYFELPGETVATKGKARV